MLITVGAVGVLAAAVAIWGIFSQRAMARRRNIFEHIARNNMDTEVIKARTKFLELAKAPDGLAPWAADAQETSTELQSIILILNDFELISIGIQRGIIDEKLYRKWFQSNVVRHWRYAKPFVEALRTRTGSLFLFYEFEQMAKWFDGTIKMPKREWRTW